jgi:hypothetical protein
VNNDQIIDVLGDDEQQAARNTRSSHLARQLEIDRLKDSLAEDKATFRQHLRTRADEILGAGAADAPGYPISALGDEALAKLVDDDDRSMWKSFGTARADEARVEIARRAAPGLTVNQ